MADGGGMSDEIRALLEDEQDAEFEEVRVVEWVWCGVVGGHGEGGRKGGRDGGGHDGGGVDEGGWDNLHETKAIHVCDA